MLGDAGSYLLNEGWPRFILRLSALVAIWIYGKGHHKIEPHGSWTGLGVLLVAEPDNQSPIVSKMQNPFGGGMGEAFGICG